MKFSVVSIFLVLALGAFVPARSSPPPISYNDLDVLNVVTRPAFPENIRGVWRLILGQNDPACPKTIEYTTWDFRPNTNTTIDIVHNTILHNGQRCDANEGGRKFVLYSSALFDNELNNPDKSIPAPLLNMLRKDGRNIRARLANNAVKERYYIGFEPIGRFCRTAPKFDKGTTAFLMRPFNAPITIQQIDRPLAPGSKYLLMLPPYSDNQQCLYIQRVDPIEPSPSPDSPSETPGAGTPGAGTPGAGTPGAGTGPSGNDGNAAATVEPSPTNAPNICFPADAEVRLRNGQVIEMEKLSIGQEVEVAPGVFSPVFMFTHKQESTRNTFVALTTASGHKLSLTAGHYMYLNGRLAAAKTASVGDVVELADGSFSSIASKSYVERRGLYNPQTLHGDILVNGIRASTYTTSVEHKLAHAILSPVRAVFKYLSFDLTGQSLHSGSDFLANKMPSGPSTVL